MRVVALISGGKDSCFNMMHVVGEGHQLVALANLYPNEPDTDELDSYMYQTVGHEAINLHSEAMDLPLFRRKITGSSKTLDLDYIPDTDDEVEDLYQLLKEMKKSINFDAVASGAILSDYQRIRVESVCARLGLTSLSYLWRREQGELLQEMISCGLTAILIKTAALGLEPRKHLGKTLQEMSDKLHDLNTKYGCHICGEGGEFESFTLDCPLFKKRIVIDESQVTIHSNDYFAPVGYLKLNKMHLETKPPSEVPSMKSLPLKTSAKWVKQYAGSLNSYETCGNTISSPEKIHWEGGTKKFRSQPSVGLANHKNFLTIANLQGITSDEITPQIVEHITLQLMKQLEDILSDHGHTLQNVCYVQIYVSDMSHYQHINRVYSQYFTHNPPARACIGCINNSTDNVEKTILQMYCLSCKDYVNRKTMHVQGISHWAPANIGPFSQCISVDGILFVSGTIALVPGNMLLIESGAEHQATLALNHVKSVLMAMANIKVNNFLQCICYITNAEDIKYGVQAWNTATKCTDEGTPCEVLYLVVNELPKGASAEWQGIACHAENSFEVSCERDSKMMDRMTISWNLTRMQSRDDTYVYSFTMSIEASNENLTYDIDNSVKCFQDHLQTWLECHGLHTCDIIQASLFYVGDLHTHTVHEAWTRSLNVEDEVAITPIQVRNIFNGGHFCVMTLNCFISTVLPVS